MFRKETLALAVLLMITAPARVEADLFDTYGFDAHGIAMGQALCATADNLSAAYYNPAGLAEMKDHAIGLSYLFNRASMDVTGAATEPPDDDDLGAGNIIFGLGLNLNQIMNLPRNVTFALAMSSEDDGTMVRLEDLEEDRYAYISYGPAIARSVIYTGLGIELIPGALSIGLGAHTMIGGEVASTMTLSADDLSTTQAVTPSEQNFWMEMKIKPHAVAGIKCKPTSQLTLGLCYRDGIEVDMDPFLADLALTLGSHAAHIKAYTAILSFWQPSTYQAGCAYQMGGLTLEADLSYACWSDFKQSAPRELRRQAPDFDNIISYHLGLEYRLEGGRFWGGYQYVPTPLPDEMLGSHYLDADRHILSIGAGATLRDPLGLFNNPLAISLALQDQILPEKTFSSNGAEYSLEGSIISAIFSLRLTF